MTLAVTAAVDTLVPQPRIRLSVTGTSAAPDPVGTASTVVVYRTDPDGIRRKVILNAGSVLSGGQWVGFDYHMPFNEPVSYSAVVDGVTSALSGQVTLASSVSWWIHPNNPNLSVQISGINEIAARTVASTAVLSYAIGAQYPVAVTEGTRRSRTGSIVARLESKEEQRQAEALLRYSGPVLFNLAAEDAEDEWWDESWAWVQAGDYTIDNPGAWLYFPERELSMPYTVVDTPSGSEVPIWTFADVKALGTFADVKAQYRTLSDLATNTTSTAGGTGLLKPDATQVSYYGAAVLTADPSQPEYFLPGDSSTVAP